MSIPEQPAKQWQLYIFRDGQWVEHDASILYTTSDGQPQERVVAPWLTERQLRRSIEIAVRQSKPQPRLGYGPWSPSLLEAPAPTWAYNNGTTWERL